MPREVRPWFRFYTEAMTDRKIRRLTPTQRWVWVAILSAAGESPVRGRLLVARGEAMTARELADYADVRPQELRPAIEKMAALGMVHWDDGTLVVTNWAGRQFESDTSTIRTRRHRGKEQVGNVPTLYDDTDVDLSQPPSRSPHDPRHDPRPEAVTTPATTPPRQPGNPRKHGATAHVGTVNRRSREREWNGPDTETETELLTTEGGERTETLPTTPATYPTHCLDHRHIENPGPCGGCKTAREALERIDHERTTARLAARITACTACDPDGWQLDTTGNPTARRCKHPA